MKIYNLFKLKSPFLVPLIAVLIVLCTDFCRAQEAVVKDYKIYFGKASVKGVEFLVLRRMEKGGRVVFLGVDPSTLNVQLLDIPATNVIAMNWQQVLIGFKGTPYIQAIQAASSQSFALQDAGIVHGFPRAHGVTVTVDLCPSHKPLDRIIFTTLIAEFKNIEKPVPIALSLTGRFMLTHGEDLNWLKGLVKSGDISITWINHTYNHHYNPKVPLRDNFLLEPGTDLNFEILGTEIAMLQNGLLPSVFFRFPGLVSDQSIVSKVLSYGIIPVGSDAWLAKGQAPNSGSIILIHGNGNEPVGVNDFIKLLKAEKIAVMGNEWLMYDLRESVEDEFQ